MHNQLLNEIAKKLHYSAPSAYESAYLVYKIIITDEEWTSFSAGYVISGKKVPPKNFSKVQEDLESLLSQVHNEMKKENKDWRKISLNIDENKKVNVEFDYSEQNI